MRILQRDEIFEAKNGAGAHHHRFDWFIPLCPLLLGTEHLDHPSIVDLTVFRLHYRRKHLPLLFDLLDEVVQFALGHTLLDPEVLATQQVSI